MRPNDPNQPSNTARPTPNTQHPTPNTQHTTRIQRTTLTGEVIEVEVTSSTPAPPTSPGMFSPTGTPTPSQHPTPNTERRSPGASYAAMNAAGVPYGNMTAQMLREQARSESEVTPGEKWELFLAIAAPIALLSAWLAHVAPHLVMWIGFADLFVLSLVMGATGAVPSYDDSYLDVGVMLVVTFMFGPILALVAYLFVSLVKQECNTAIVGLLALQILIFQGLALAFASNTNAIKHVGVFMVFGVMQFFSIFIAFLGWLLSNFFRPVGE